MENPRQEIDAIKTFDPKTTMLVDKSQEEKLAGFLPVRDSAATISLVSYEPNDMTYDYTASSDQLAVFSDIYYNSGKGWNAYLDGNPIEHFRCNYLLRGMKLPGGTHILEFKFEPSSYYTGETVSLIFSILIVLGFLGILGWEGKNALDNLGQAE